MIEVGSGLEIQDPNNSEVGIEQPVCATYKHIIHDEYFYPCIEEIAIITIPLTLRWGGSEDATGIAIPLHFDKSPVFCEVVFEKPYNLMMELNGKWFYKSPTAKIIDLMSAFFERPLTGTADLKLKIFAPPASGENDPLQGDDWQNNYYTTITKLPIIRIRFEPIEAEHMTSI